VLVDPGDLRDGLLVVLGGVDDRDLTELDHRAQAFEFGVAASAAAILRSGSCDRARLVATAATNDAASATRHRARQTSAWFGRARPSATVLVNV
jgi:hypothetical protein